MSDQIKISESHFMVARNSTGRPTKYSTEFCQIVVELGKAGLSIAQIASHFDVCRQTIDNWARRHPEFLEALSRARTHAQAWWEFQAMAGLTHPKFNCRLWEKSVQARFREDYTSNSAVIDNPRNNDDVMAQAFRESLELLSKDQLLALEDILDTLDD